MDPPKGARCEAVLSLSDSMAGKPMVRYCGKAAVLTAKTKPFGVQGYFCLECYDQLDKNGRIMR